MNTYLCPYCHNSTLVAETIGDNEAYGYYCYHCKFQRTTSRDRVWELIRHELGILEQKED